VPLLALGGEASPDAEITALSTAPAGAVAQVGEYLRSGDVDNVEQMLRFLADTFLLEGYGFDPPKGVGDLGVYLPGRGDVTLAEALAEGAPGAPVIGITFYRSHRLTGNTEFVDELWRAIRRAGATPVPVWSYTLRRAPGDGRVAALELLDGHVDALITTMLATGGADRGDAAGALTAADGGNEEQMDWDARALEALDVPVIQGLCVTMSRARWEEGHEGLLPLDAATQVAIPEFDGRIIAGPISFKERDEADSPVGTPVPRYVPDAERCDRLATLAGRHPRKRGAGGGSRSC
jgi:cobaltochelatase CobN